MVDRIWNEDKTSGVASGANTPLEEGKSLFPPQKKKTEADPCVACLQSAVALLLVGLTIRQAGQAQGMEDKKCCIQE